MLQNAMMVIIHHYGFLKSVYIIWSLIRVKNNLLLAMMTVNMVTLGVTVENSWNIKLEGDNNE